MSNFWHIDLSTILSNLITVLGWFVGAWWAIKQINLAHEKNRQLEQELIARSMRDGLYKQFLEIYSELSASIGDLISELNLLGINLSFDKHAVEKFQGEIRGGWLEYLDRVNQAYSKLSKQFFQLENWLAATGECVQNASALYTVLERFKKDFHISSEKDKRDENSWQSLQTALILLKIDGCAYSNQYFSAAEQVLVVSHEILKQLKENAALVQRQLIQTSQNEIR